MHTTTPPSEDIDLLALLQRIVLFFQKFKWLFLAATILGLAFGYLTYLQMPKVYKSRLILHSFMLSNLDYIQVIDNWNTLLKKGEHAALAETMSMDPAMLRKVHQLKGSEIQRVFTPTNPNGFYVDVFVTDTSVLDELQAGILTGLENIDYIRKQLAIKRSNLQQLITQVESELIKLDSTKSSVESIIKNRTSQPSSLMMDVTGLNKQHIDLTEKLLYYKQDFQFTTAVQVLQGFSKFGRPSGPRKIVWLGLGWIGFMAIAWLIALFISIREKLRLYNQSQLSK
jgi:hypothetical protein